MHAQDKVRTAPAICMRLMLLPRSPLTTAATPTRCDPTTQYLLYWGGAKANDICGPLANPCPAGSFLSAPGSNANATTNGTAGVCTNYTMCLPGSYVAVAGGSEQDQVCALCPAGKYGVDGVECISCQQGVTYNPDPGATSCTACTECLSGEAAVAPMYTCPANQTCTPGFLSLCNASSDAVCMDCPSTWSQSATTQLCTPCAAGHHRVTTQQGGYACVPCQPNTFCDSPDTFSVCPNLQAYEREPGAGLTYAPSSPQGASRGLQCTCATAGGFDAQAGAGLVPCIPCPPGYHLPTGSPPHSTCAPCPQGSWSAQALVWDHYKCPLNRTAAVLGPLGQVIPHQTVPAAQQTPKLCMITVGATVCTACPHNHTKRWPATSANDCSRCSAGQWYDSTSQRCHTCSAPCAAPDAFETQPCTDNTDRVCMTCNMSCDRLGEYTAGCPGSDLDQPDRGCGPCNNLPPQNAHYLHKPTNSRILSPSDCPWACNQGYYAVLSPASCTACTSYNSTTCPAGFLFSPCTATADASCSRRCANSTLPTAHASYILTKTTPVTEEQGQEALATSTNTTVVVQPMNATDTGPNQGCLWDCDANYTLYTTTGGLHTCRLTI